MHASYLSYAVIVLLALLLSVLAISSEQQYETIAQARASWEAAPDDAALALELGAILARVGALAAASEVLDEARRLDPTSARACVASALVLRDRGHHKDAAELLEDALDRGVIEGPVYEELSFLLLSLGASDRAREVAREGFARHPASVRLQMALGLALASTRDGKREAVRLLTEALEQKPPDPARIHLELGSALLVLGENEAALAHLREAVALDPESSEAHFRLGNALRATGDLESAKTELLLFERLRQTADKEKARARSLRAAMNDAQRLALDNQLYAALARLTEILFEYPEAVRAYALRAKVHSSLGRDAEALADVVRARELAPFDVEHNFLEGRFLLKLGRSAEAETALRRSLALDAELADAHELLGVALANQGAHERATRHFAEALELGAESAALHLNFAESLKRIGRNEEAERQLDAYRRLAK